MGDPVSAGVVGSVLAPATTPTITGALATGMGAGSLFGFDPTIGGVGQGIMEGIGGLNTWMNQNPTTSAIGFNLANRMMTPNQPRFGGGASIRQGAQMQPVDYMSLLNPQQQTVIRPATPSLI